MLQLDRVIRIANEVFLTQRPRKSTEAGESEEDPLEGVREERPIVENRSGRSDRALGWLRRLGLQQAVSTRVDLAEIRHPSDRREVDLGDLTRGGNTARQDRLALLQSCNNGFAA